MVKKERTRFCFSKFFVLLLVVGACFALAGCGGGGGGTINVNKTFNPVVSIDKSFAGIATSVRVGNINTLRVTVADKIDNSIIPASSTVVLSYSGSDATGKKTDFSGELHEYLIWNPANSSLETVFTIPAADKAQKVTVTAQFKDVSQSMSYYVADVPKTIAINAEDTVLKANGFDTVPVTLEVKDANGYPVADGTTLKLTVDNGTLDCGGGIFSATCNYSNFKNGNLTTTLKSAVIPSSKDVTATLRVYSGDILNQKAFTFKPDEAGPYSIEIVDLTPPNITTFGDVAVLTVLVKNTNTGKPEVGKQVQFNVDSGGSTSCPTGCVTDTMGKTTLQITSGEKSATDTVNIVAYYEGVNVAKTMSFYDFTISDVTYTDTTYSIVSVTGSPSKTFNFSGVMKNTKNEPVKNRWLNIKMENSTGTLTLLTTPYNKMSDTAGSFSGSYTITGLDPNDVCTAKLTATVLDSTGNKTTKSSSFEKVLYPNPNFDLELTTTTGDVISYSTSSINFKIRGKSNLNIAEGTRVILSVTPSAESGSTSLVGVVAAGSTTINIPYTLPASLSSTGGTLTLNAKWINPLCISSTVTATYCDDNNIKKEAKSDEKIITVKPALYKPTDYILSLARTDDVALIATADATKQITVKTMITGAGQVASGDCINVKTDLGNITYPCIPIDITSKTATFDMRRPSSPGIAKIEASYKTATAVHYIGFKSSAISKILLDTATSTYTIGQTTNFNVYLYDENSISFAYLLSANLANITSTLGTISNIVNSQSYGKIVFDLTNVSVPSNSVVVTVKAPKMAYYSNNSNLIKNVCTVKGSIVSGEDDDCDGRIDEEILDGIDNDSDGLIDEDNADTVLANYTVKYSSSSAINSLMLTSNKYNVNRSNSGNSLQLTLKAYDNLGLQSSDNLDGYLRNADSSLQVPDELCIEQNCTATSVVSFNYALKLISGATTTTLFVNPANATSGKKLLSAAIGSIVSNNVEFMFTSTPTIFVSYYCGQTVKTDPSSVLTLTGTAFDTDYLPVAEGNSITAAETNGHLCTDANCTSFATSTSYLTEKVPGSVNLYETNYLKAYYKAPSTAIFSEEVSVLNCKIKVENK